DIAAFAQGLLGAIENSRPGIIAAEFEIDPGLVLAAKVRALQQGAAHLDGPVKLSAHAVEIAQCRTDLNGSMMVAHGPRQVVDSGQGILGRIWRNGREEVGVIVAQPQKGP
ncbi:MAG: hypothetical protein CVU63_25680, partial [Deltaproteobacteria bacterium HGW-Deltaproteobacteria-20]